MNFQTQKKIEEIKELIKNGKPLDEITRTKFGTRKKKDIWLDKTHQSFTEEELKYLNHSFTPEFVEAEEIIVETPKPLEVENIAVSEVSVEEIQNNKSTEERQRTEEIVEEKPAQVSPFNFNLDTQKVFKSFDELKTPQDKIQFLLTDKVLKALLFMTEGQSIVNEAEATLKFNLENVKNKYSKNIKIKNIRINEELYKEFTDFCENNKITIISALSCALEEFLEKYKDLKKEK